MFKFENTYAPFWEDDLTVDPKLVRYVSGPKAEFFTVKFPDNTVHQVHLHTLGKFRRAL